MQYSSGVTGPIALWSFSEIAFWSFFVTHFSIGSRQESQGVWLRPILGHLLPVRVLSSAPPQDLWGGPFFLAQSFLTPRLLSPAQN